MKKTWKPWAARMLKDFRETLTRVKNGPNVRPSDTLSTRATAAVVGLSASRLPLVIDYALLPMDSSKDTSLANIYCLVPKELGDVREDGLNWRGNIGDTME
uniref:Uncharacterized protein n=1 Tax=Cacopsylla melanoneura TaxID=428564 RepID=A0A8D8RTZ3_9HEMI